MASSTRLVISLGGSVIAPAGPDRAFLTKFCRALLASPHRFMIFSGGGGMARDFQKLAGIGEASHHLLDTVGIEATRVNALLLRDVLGKHAEDTIVTDPNQRLGQKRQIMIGSGWKPGASTDDCAVRFAVKNKLKTVVNISNTTHVYDKDPRHHPDAVALRKLSWKRMAQLMGDSWEPGLNRPFDPIATKLARQKKLTVVFLGPDAENLSRYLSGKPFEGTTIS